MSHGNRLSSIVTAINIILMTDLRNGLQRLITRGVLSAARFLLHHTRTIIRSPLHLRYRVLS